MKIRIRNAYKIILSRSQLVDSLKIKNIVDSLRKFNSKAEIIYKQWEYLNGFDLIEIKMEKEIKKKILSR